MPVKLSIENNNVGQTVREVADSNVETMSSDSVLQTSDGEADSDDILRTSKHAQAIDSGLVSTPESREDKIAWFKRMENKACLLYTSPSPRDS